MDKEKIRQRGKDDYKRGLDLADNPFLFDPDPAKSGWWEAGWLEQWRKDDVSHRR